jgi:DNA-binding NarL/FixJ family response regulator
MENKKIRALVVEDDPDFCFLIEKTLCAAGIEHIGSVSNAKEAVIEAVRMKPDVVLMDLCLADSVSDGIEAGKEIRLNTDAKLLILTSYEEPEVIRNACCRSFASGYIFKSQFGLLPETVKSAAKGRTPQEYMIVSLILSELSVAERSVLELLMGKDLKLQSSPKTISNQKNNLLKKLGLSGTEELRHVFKDLV